MQTTTDTVPRRGPQDVLEDLLEGNRRYADVKMIHPNQGLEWRRKLVAGQNPSATILTCSDSRVVPEIIFDKGLGDIFVLRVAGNVIDDMILGSIEYAVGHLNTPLVMVLGHSGCGAVKATLADTPVEGHAVSIATAIQQSADSSRDEPGDHVDNTARANARRMADQLKESKPVLAGPVRTGKVAVVAAFYRLDTGMVEIL